MNGSGAHTAMKRARRSRRGGVLALGLRNLPAALACSVYKRRWARKLPGFGAAVGLSPSRATGGGRVLVRLGTTDVQVYREIYVSGEYEAARALPQDSVTTIVDLGSNVGLSLRYLLGVFPGARAVGVEPDAGNLAMCRRNIEAGGDDGRCVLVQAFAGGRRRSALVDRSGKEWSYRLGDDVDRAGPSAGSVPVITVPDVLDQAGIDGEIGLLKCDIEGAEAEVFADCAAWVGRVRAMVVEVHGPYQRADLERDLAQAGYRCQITPLKERTNPALAVYFIRRTDA